MPEHDANLRALRLALEASPANVPLRKHLAATLAELGRHAEAETEYREALELAPDDEELKLGLARAFFEGDKTSAAFVVVEDLIKNARHPARAYVLHARLLLATGDVERAVREYRKALDEDPEVEDAGLSDRLGVQGGAEEELDDEREVVEGRVRIAGEAAGGELEDVEIEEPDIDFDDVGGMEGVKDEVRMKIIHPLEHPEIYEAYGKKVGGGILMFGPPGCGKTHLARATAGEVNASFLAVGIHDVLDMWIGNSERRLHELFARARESRPCILFFDEVDALGARRSDMRASAGRHLINQFLSELDGIKASNEGVLVLAATNAPWHVDSAFRRPGRFDRVIFVPPPDREAAAAILGIVLRGKPVRDVDCAAVAKRCDGLSGADIEAIVDLAVEDKLRLAMKAGVPEPLETKDLIKAAKRVKGTTREWFSTAKNYAVYSNEGGIYDDILRYLKLK